jgi:UDP-glucose 4-epimerase
VVLLERYSHNSFPNAIKAASKIALDSLPADAPEQDKADTEVTVFKGDITKREDIERVFAACKDKGGIWGVIHIAAHKAVGESGQKPLQYYNNNVGASIHLLDVSCHFTFCV